MTPEERERFESMERVLQFIVNNSAQFSTDLDRIKRIADQNMVQVERNSTQIGID
jgi:hypothetical protein